MTHRNIKDKQARKAEREERKNEFWSQHHNATGMNRSQRRDIQFGRYEKRMKVLELSKAWRKPKKVKVEV